METKEETLERLTSYHVKFLEELKCTVLDADAQKGYCKMQFELGTNYCHSIDIVQGGFVTAMLDAVTSHAIFAARTDIMGLSTLELKVSFYNVSRAGKFIAEGRVDKMGRSISFLSGELFDEAGTKTASITSTAKVFIKK